MIAYHYSVTYRGDPSLTNDYRRNFLRAEPYIRALETGEEIFSAMVFFGMYQDRCMRAEKTGWFEYAKDAVEAVFEYVRKREFPGQISRVGCIYGVETLEEARRLAMEDWGNDLDTEECKNLQILELQLDSSRTAVLDQSFYNQAYECMLDYHGDLQKIEALARDYFGEKKSSEFLPELLSDGNNTVLRTIPVF